MTFLSKFVTVMMNAVIYSVGLTVAAIYYVCASIVNLTVCAMLVAIVSVLFALAGFSLVDTFYCGLIALGVMFVAINIWGLFYIIVLNISSSAESHDVNGKEEHSGFLKWSRKHK